MKNIYTEIEIDAPIERVWNILINFADFPAWNPFIRCIEGEPAIGQRLRASVQPQGSKSMSFATTVLVATPNKELRWVGHQFIPGIFDAEHAFCIEILGANKIRFIQKEQYKGFLVPLVPKNLEDGLRAGFVAMNQALKVRAERSVAPDE